MLHLHHCNSQDELNERTEIMTIEQNLSSIAESLKIIAAALSKGVNQTHTPVAVPVPYVEPAPVVVAQTVVPNVQAAPIPVAPKMDTPTPVVTAQAAPATASPSDFNLTTFVLDSYKALGPVKGAGIQAVLQSVGAKNINDVKPEQYATVKAGVEALMVA